MLFFKKQIVVLSRSRKQERHQKKQIGKKQITVLKMSDPCLFDMELEKHIENNNQNLVPVSLFLEIEQELSENLLKQEGGGDSTDGPLNFTENLTNDLQAEFEETLGEYGDKKLFLRSLTKLFAILLSTRTDSVEKIKKYRKYCT